MEQAPRRIKGLSDIAGNYDCLFCDVWGVLHNGVEAYGDTVEALTAFRQERNGTVVLVTNAPRPARDVAERLYAMDIPQDAFDHLVTSGDVTRATVGENRGANVYHLGPERDLGYYEGLDITLTNAETADLISCTGLFDDENEMAIVAQQGSWNSLQASYQHDSAPTYRWTNAIRALFRPILTAGLFGLVYLMWQDLQEGRILAEFFSDAELRDIVRYIVMSVVFTATTAGVWWFGERAFAPPGIKNR